MRVRGSVRHTGPTGVDLAALQPLLDTGIGNDPREQVEGARDLLGIDAVMASQNVLMQMDDGAADGDR